MGCYFQYNDLGEVRCDRRNMGNNGYCEEDCVEDCKGYISEDEE